MTPVLATKNDLQQSIDNSFATKAAEIEESTYKQLAEKDRALQLVSQQLVNKDKSYAKRSAEMEKSFLKRSIEAEQSFAKKAKDMEMSLAKKKEQAELSLAKKTLETDRLQTEFNQTTNMLQRQLSQERNKAQELSSALETAEQTHIAIQTQWTRDRNAFQMQLSQEREERTNTAKKLTSTLDTLQTTCESAHNIELKLTETEEKLQQTEEMLLQAEERVQQTGIRLQESEEILQNKLESEVKNKNALIDIHKEMEKHLNLERERGDLLQQELESAIQLDNKQREELKQASLGNKQLQELVESVSRDNAQFQKQTRSSQEASNRENTFLQEQIRKYHSELEEASQDNAHMKEQIHKCHSELEQASRSSSQMKEQMRSLQEASRRDNAQLQEQLKLTQETNNKQCGELERASRDSAHLQKHISSLEEVNRNLQTKLGHISEEYMHLQDELKGANENINALQIELSEKGEVLNSSKSEYSKLLSETKVNKERLEKTSEMNSLLEIKVTRLEAKINDQIMDLEAARMSEADVERSLEENLQQGREIEVELRARVETLETKIGRTTNEMQNITEQLADECRQKDKLHKLKSALESETDALKEKLGKTEKDYGDDRVKIANALAGFDEEMTNAEAKLRTVIGELEKEKGKVTELKMVNETHERAVSEMQVDLRQKMEMGNKNLRQEFDREKEKMELDMEKIKDECKARVSKYQQDISVYEEALKMLQKQVSILQEMADADCEKCIERAKMVTAEEARLKEMVSKAKADAEGKIKQLEIQAGVLQETIKQIKATEELRVERLLSKAKKDAQDEVKLLKAQLLTVQETAKSASQGNSQCAGIILQDKAEAQRTIEMLQKKVDTLQEIVDAECKRREEETKGGAEQLTRQINAQKLQHESAMMEKDTTIADLQERCQTMDKVRQELSSQLNTKKLDCESAMMKKNAVINELQEKCHRREETMEKLETLCTKARTDLLYLRNQKKFLEGSLERLMQHIKDLKHSREEIDAESMDIDENVARNPTRHTSPKKESGKSVGVDEEDPMSIKRVVMNGFDGVCGTVVPELPKPIKDFGSELDALLTSIETQLEVGKCGEVPKSESRFNLPTLSTKSW